MLRKLKNVLKKLLNKYESGLIKKLINGINAAIEIDSAKEANIDRINTTFNSFFLLTLKCDLILFKIFIGDGRFLFLYSEDTIFFNFKDIFYLKIKANYSSIYLH